MEEINGGNARKVDGISNTSYESPNGVVITVNCAEWSHSRSIVYSITARVPREENGFMGAAVQIKV